MMQIYLMNKLIFVDNNIEHHISTFFKIFIYAWYVVKSELYSNGTIHA